MSSSQLTCRWLAAVAVQAIPRVVDADLVILTTTKPSAEPSPPPRPASPPLLVGLNILNLMTEMAYSGPWDASIAVSVRVLVQLLSKMMVFSADPRVSSALSQCHEHTRVCRWPAYKSGISATVSTHAHAQSYLRCCVCAIACAISYQKLEPPHCKCSLWREQRGLA